MDLPYAWDRPYDVIDREKLSRLKVSSAGKPVSCSNCIAYISEISSKLLLFPIRPKVDQPPIHQDLPPVVSLHFHLVRHILSTTFSPFEAASSCQFTRCSICSNPPMQSASSCEDHEQGEKLRNGGRIEVSHVKLLLFGDLTIDLDS